MYLYVHCGSCAPCALHSKRSRRFLEVPLSREAKQASRSARGDYAIASSLRGPSKVSKIIAGGSNDWVESAIKISGLVVLGICLVLVSAASAASERSLEFTPHHGFNGNSQGNGTLRLFFGKPRPFHVESRGVNQADGVFRLDQIVTFEGKLSQERFWLIKTTRQHHYTATLSDAPGAVTGFSNGSRLVLKYRVKGPLVMHQTLEILPDGRTIDNVGKITLLGIPVGRLQEKIERRD